MVKQAKQQSVIIYTTPKAAQALGVSRQTVWNWLNDKTLDEVPSAGRVRLVDAASVEKLKAERQQGAA